MGPDYTVKYFKTLEANGYKVDQAGISYYWNNKVHGYELTDADAVRFLTELITWGRNNGMAGIRPWAPELDWANPWIDFNQDTMTATAKTAIFNALKAATA